VSPDASERLTVAEAARRLGVSQDAVRKRIKRDTIGYVRHDDGRVYVYLDPSETPQATDQGGVQDALIAELQDRVVFLQRELERKDAIMLNMTEAMKALNPPASLQRESPVSPDSPGPSDTPTDTSGERQTPDTRPWWQRWFGSVDK
jgi:excisionase family DNA binding protein